MVYVYVCILCPSNHAKWLFKWLRRSTFYISDFVRHGWNDHGSKLSTSIYIGTYIHIDIYIYVYMYHILYMDGFSINTWQTLRICWAPMEKPAEKPTVLPRPSTVGSTRVGAVGTFFWQFDGRWVTHIMCVYIYMGRSPLFSSIFHMCLIIYRHISSYDHGLSHSHQMWSYVSSYLAIFWRCTWWKLIK